MYLVDLSFTQTTYRKQCSNSTDDNGSVFLTHTQLVNTSIYYVSWYHAILSSATLTSVDMRKSHCFECQFVIQKAIGMRLSWNVRHRYSITIHFMFLFRRLSWMIFVYNFITYALIIGNNFAMLLLTLRRALALLGHFRRDTTWSHGNDGSPEEVTLHPFFQFFCSLSQLIVDMTGGWRVFALE